MKKNSRKKRPIKKQTSLTDKNGRKSPWFWIGLVCFSSIWMFILGILVGRGTAPIQFDIHKLQKQLTALNDAVEKKEKENLRAYSEAMSNKTDVEFYEKLKQTGDGSDLGKKPMSQKNISEKKSLSKATKLKYLSKIRSKIPINDEDTAIETAGYFTIQVYSAKDLSEAKKVVATLKKKGYPAYSVASTVKGKGVWYRVRVGPFKEKAKAREKVASLKKDKYDAILISL